MGIQKITKDQVHEVFNKKKTTGVEIARAVRDYFKLNIHKVAPVINVEPRPNEDLTDFAQRLFGDVETRGPAIV